MCLKFNALFQYLPYSLKVCLQSELNDNRDVPYMLPEKYHPNQLSGSREEF